MKTKLSKRTVDTVTPDTKDLFVWDTDLKGFGLKVTRTGRKIYIIQYRLPALGKPLNQVTPKRYTIGEHGSPWTPDKARERAILLLRDVDEGNDPAQLEQARQQEEQNRQIEEDARSSRCLRAGLEDYLKRRVRNRLVKAAAIESLLKANIPADWFDRDVSSVQTEDIQAALDQLVTDKRPGTAREFRKHTHALFEFLLARPKTYGLTSNPVAATAVEDCYKPRDRVMSDDELREIWFAAESLGYPFGPLTKLLILTGQRLREAAEAEWSEFSDGKLWSITASRTKNDKAHLVHITPLMTQTLATLPKIYNENGTTKYLFTTTGQSPASGFSKAKQHIDKAIQKAREATHGPKATPMAHWTFHDLRRTFATGAARIGTAPHIIEKVLNHNPKALQGVAGIYNRFEYLAERKEAIDAWDRHISILIQPDS